MLKFMTLARRELAAYFFSPLAYVVAVCFFGACCWVFFFGLRPFFPIDPIFVTNQEASLRGLFVTMAWAMTVAAPLLAMRLLSEEFSIGTIETLMTAPVTDTQVILGKFLGVLVYYLVLLATTVTFLVLIAVYGRPDPGVVLMGYLGLVLLGAAFLSVGLFASTLTRMQIVAGIVGITILLGFVATMQLLTIHGSTGVAQVAGRLNAMTYFKEFARGVFDTRGTVFFLSIAALFLFLSVKALESRRWR